MFCKGNTSKVLDMRWIRDEVGAFERTCEDSETSLFILQ